MDLERTEDLLRGVRGHLWRCGFHPPRHRIEVALSDGHLLIEGEVPDQRDVDLIGTLVMALDSVRSLDNRLKTRTRNGA